jgi:hypothetical protein
MGNGVFGWHQGVRARQNFCDRGGRVDVGMRSSYVLVMSMQFLMFKYLVSKIDQKEIFRS